MYHLKNLDANDREILQETELKKIEWCNVEWICFAQNSKLHAGSRKILNKLSVP